MLTVDVVFLLDVDNTLLDGDRIVEDLRVHLKGEFGFASTQRYWTIWVLCSATASTSNRAAPTSSGC